MQRSQARKRGQRLAIALAAIVVVAGAWFVLHLSIFGARAVTVVGPHAHTSTTAILAAAQLSGADPLISLDDQAVASRVEALPYVGAVTVTRHWPDGVRIHVTERTPCMQMAGPTTSFTELDCTGRALVTTGAATPGLPTLVVHDGTTTLAPPAPGSWLPPVATPGLLVTSHLPPAYVALVATVTQAPDRTVEVGLADGITIAMGTATDLRAKEEAAASILAGGTSLSSNSVIDVSAPGSPVVGHR